MKHISYLPHELAKLFTKHFSFPENPLFGSVATIKNDFPRIRTMRIYEFDKKGCPILLTHTGSNKWKEFSQHRQVSVNIVSESKLLQVTVSGHLTLATTETDFEAAKHYWSMIRPDVKKIYDSRHKVGEAYSELSDLAISQEPPKTFGMAYIIPSFWETLHLEDEYAKSCRYQYRLNENTWERQRIQVG